jgi:hypothetical protein
MYLAVGGVVLRDEPPEGPANESKDLCFAMATGVGAE